MVGQDKGFRIFFTLNQLIGFYIAGMTDVYIIRFCKHNNLCTDQDIAIFNI